MNTINDPCTLKPYYLNNNKFSGLHNLITLSEQLIIKILGQ